MSTTSVLDRFAAPTVGLHSLILRSLMCVFTVVAISTPAEAVTISMVEYKPSWFDDDEYQLWIIVDTAPEQFTFANGGIDLSLTSTNPGVIKFTYAQVIDPSFFGGAAVRWTRTLVRDLADNNIELLRGLSIGTVGLDSILQGNSMDGGTRFWFAAIDYEVVGPGRTELVLSPGSGGDSFVHRGEIVPVELVNLQLGPYGIPEPNTLVIVAMGVALLTRRGTSNRRRRLCILA